MKGIARLAVLALAFAGCSSAPESIPPPIEGRAVMDDGVSLYYRSLGSGEPALVVPVGFYLEEALAPLARGRRVVFYDPRGRGRSDRAAGTISFERQLADLEQLRTALGLDSMALLGWSGLGMEMAAYAIRHPARVTRLIQMGAVPPASALMQELGGDTRSTRTDQAAVDSLAARWERGAFDGTEADFCRRYAALTMPANFVDSSLVTLVPDVCRYENEWPVNLWPYFGALLGSFAGYDLRPGLDSLTVPRLVIHGREDGVPVAGGRAWAAGYPTARFVELSPSGHFPHLEQPEVVLRLVDTFLRGQWPEAATQLPR